VIEPGLVRVEVDERMRRVVLCHGANALDEALLDALLGTLDGLAGEGAPALVLSSAHRTVFCPGLDLKRLDQKPREAVRTVMVGFNAVLRRLAAYPGPTVAAIDGHAIAGGCLLAMACDRRVMARFGARLGLSEVNLGIPVPAGAVHMLLELYSTRAVEQMVLEGDGFGGERAAELGLVERLAERGAVLADASRLASHLAARPASSFATAKRYLRGALAEAMRVADEAELECFLDHWFEADTQDRIGALVAAM
jgi:Delta3-Delta2-enoyl-CoA isomerase